MVIEVNYIKNMTICTGQLQLKENEDDVELFLTIDGTIFVARNENYFDALILLRRQLEERNIVLLCKGCCKNVYPSGMILSMGYGDKAYRLTIGEPAKMNSLVYIFEPCDEKDYASVDEQHSFFEEWCNSITRRR